MGTKTRAVRTATTAKKTNILLGLISFMLGCITTATILLNAALPDSNPKDDMIILDYPPPAVERMAENNPALHPSSLQGIRILIIIAAYDFGQLPHLEEVLDSYQALCVTGAQTVDVIVHATVPYPVALIDLWNARLLPSCQGVFSFRIILKPSSLKLHLVDCHRPYFYEHLHQYDLFIYTEDDIRVTPLTVAAYLDETARIQRIKGDQASDFNVGIVRYEYNYPSNVVIDDKTRHATQNVTRVYWEHGQYPLFPKAMDAVPDKDLATTHVHMANHHQGMFLATQQLLRAWKDRKGCDFDKVRNRPGLKNRPSQPAEGTQRVWMSSQMLYGSHHCKVQQVIPVASFGTLTVLHLPNKNYRRVGHFRNRTFSDGSEKFEVSDSLLTAMHLHLETTQRLPQHRQLPYRGIQMLDEVDTRRDRTPLLERRMAEYQAYVDRGGILSEEDRTKTDLVEER